jgi:hypothetical protein
MRLVRLEAGTTVPSTAIERALELALGAGPREPTAPD